MGREREKGLLISFKMLSILVIDELKESISMH